MDEDRLYGLQEVSKPRTCGGTFKDFVKRSIQKSHSNLSIYTDLADKKTLKFKLTNDSTSMGYAVFL